MGRQIHMYKKNKQISLRSWRIKWGGREEIGRKKKSTDLSVFSLSRALSPPPPPRPFMRLLRRLKQIKRQTSHESNPNDEKQKLLQICIKFDLCKVQRSNGTSQRS